MTHADTLVALADPTRRTIFEAVVERPRAVRELVECVGVSQPAVSQHLKVLREAELVVATPEGASRIYAARPEGLASLEAYLEGLWGDVLGAYRASFDDPADP